MQVLFFILNVLLILPFQNCGRFEANLSSNGEIENPDGSKYEGYFEKNKKSGFGKYYYNQNKYYEGQWLAGKQHGKGKIVKYGVEEEGVWVEGKKQK